MVGSKFQLYLFPRRSVISMISISWFWWLVFFTSNNLLHMLFSHLYWKKDKWFLTWLGVFSPVLSAYFSIFVHNHFIVLANKSNRKKMLGLIYDSLWLYVYACVYVWLWKPHTHINRVRTTKVVNQCLEHEMWLNCDKEEDKNHDHDNNDHDQYTPTCTM